MPLSTLAIIAALATAVIGGWLAVHFLLARRPAFAGGTALLHALGALATLAALAALLWSDQADAGAATVGPDFRVLAWWLLLPAAAFGLATFAARRRGRTVKGGLMAVHATLAIFGVVLLLAAG